MDKHYHMTSIHKNRRLFKWFLIQFAVIPRTIRVDSRVPERNICNFRL